MRELRDEARHIIPPNILSRASIDSPFEFVLPCMAGGVEIWYSALEFPVVLRSGGLNMYESRD